MPVMSLSMSCLPYVVLTVVTLSVLLIPSLNEVLRQVRIGLPFPAVATGFGVQNAAIARYAPIAVIYAPWDDAVGHSGNRLACVQRRRLLSGMG